MSVLEAIMAEEEDLELFPPSVVEAHRSGKPRQARELLRQAMQGERDPERRARQQRWHDALRLWVEPLGSAPTQATFNGIGARIYGLGGPDPDGACLGIQWLTLVYLPVIPLGAYVYERYGNEYTFYGTVPLSPKAWLVPAGWVGLGAVAAAALLALQYDHQTHTRLVAYNGFVQPVMIELLDETHEVAPRTYVEVRLPAEPQAVVASLADGERIEERDLALSGAGGAMTVYNVGGRAALAVDHAGYGTHEPPEGELLTEVVSVRPAVDLLFEPFPEEIETKGSGGVRSALITLDDPVWPAGAMQGLLEYGAPDAAERLGRASVHDGVADADVIALTAGLSGDSQALCDDLLEAHDDQIEVHRYCQSAAEMQGWGAPVEKYRQLAHDHPDAPMYQYLWGRIAPEPEEARVAYARALEVEPGHPYATLGLAYHHQVVSGDLEQALALYEALYDSGHPLGLDRMTEIVRLRQLLDEPIDVEAVRAWDPSMFSLADMLRLRDDPSLLARERARIEAESTGIEPAEIANIVANAALIAGDVPLVREMNQQGAGLEMFAALSDGGSEDDLTEAMFPTNPRQQVLAWRIADERAWDTAPHLDAIRRHSPRVADLLAGGTFSVAAVEAALVDAAPDVHPAVWFVAWRETGAPAMRERARRWALPADLPWFE